VFFLTRRVTRGAHTLCSGSPLAVTVGYYSGYSIARKRCDMRLPYSTHMLFLVPLGTLGQNQGYQLSPLDAVLSIVSAVGASIAGNKIAIW